VRPGEVSREIYKSLKGTNERGEFCSLSRSKTRSRRQCWVLPDAVKFVLFRDIYFLLFRSSSLFVLAFVLGNSLGDGVAVDTEGGGGFAQVVAVAFEGFLDVDLLEFGESFIEEDAAVEHFLDEGFDLFAQHIEP